MLLSIAYNVATKMVVLTIQVDTRVVEMELTEEEGKEMYTLLGKALGKLAPRH